MKPRYRLIELVVLTLAIAGCSNPTSPTPPVPTAIVPVQGEAPSPTAVRPTPTHPIPEEGVGAIQPARDMLAERAAHAATLLPDGKVLITGGFGQGDNAYRDSAELYDPTRGEFVSTGKMAVRRCCHTATRLRDGRVLIAGGFNGDYLSEAEIYDPASGEFTPAGSLTTPRMDHGAVLLEDGRVLLVGGVGMGWTFLASAELYDPATGNFTPTGEMSAARESHTVTKLQDGRILITGGHRGRHSAITIYDSAELYDPATGGFTATGNMNVPRHKHDAVRLADGRVLITGGSDESDDQGAYASAEIYDPSSGTFSMMSSMPTVRYKHIGTSLLLENGNALIAGGARNAVIYDPQQDVFRTVPGELGTATLSRLFSTATLLQDGSVLITGGYGVSQNVCPGAWIYTP